ncbi:DUF5110 domain-containing protein [Prevotella sp. E9-3]|uniref:TIM-barrel domain-containing protein n=1 Tax=Prevotella sp. E9-3 TaxID=2913621 RepID=UPI001EDBC6B5|nr:TIM-barrel domain-containing protein [Prevotella sp. E9-3]UKK49139.1 DUF5110 domain-containing protein [Prevotella sp. E9-3]
MKRIYLLFLTLTTAVVAIAQQSFLIDNRVAVFYPANYDAAQHQPSPIFLRELAPISQNLPDDWQLRPRFTKENGHSVATFEVGDADLYGCGEVYGDLKRNGETVGLWNKDNGLYMTEGGKRLYQSHPWVLGVRKNGTAFGLIADNTWKSKLTTDHQVRFDSEGPAFRVVVIERNSPVEVLQELAKLSGTIEMPPLWSLGFHQCRHSYVPDTWAMQIADTFRDKQIPCDVIWMDIIYMDGFRIFTFSPKEMPNPKAFNDYLHSKKFKSVFMIDPGVKVDPNYFVDQQGMANDYYVKTKDGKPFVGQVWPGDTHFPDFTRPEVRRWWSTLYPDFMATGIDGIWNDMNEPAVFDGPDSSMPEDNVHLGGEGLAEGPHLRYHNVYGYNMVKATREGMLLANPQKRPFVLSRSNFLGGQRYAATWTGDNASTWEHMKASIPMTLNMGLTGQPFNGPDIGGFARDCNGELLAHWTAIGVYFPFVRNHCSLEEVQQEPWAFGQQVEDVCRTAINRRYRLLPYVYTLFRETSQTGIPVMRPVFMADVNDETLRSEQQAFLLGGDLLIVPRWAEKPALPKGNWATFSMENGDDGYQARLALRPGSVLPLANLYQNTVDYCTDSLTLVVNLDEKGLAQGRLYEDDGDGFNYRSGDYSDYQLKANTDGKTLTVSLQKIDGKRKASNKRWLRIAQIVKGRLVYSNWQEGNQAVVKLRKK